MTSIGKIDNLKAFIKYTFYIDYTNYFVAKPKSNRSHSHHQPHSLPTIHDELIRNLVILIKQIAPMQDLFQMTRLFKNCWFFLEIALKSMCFFTLQYKKFMKNSNAQPAFDSDFYNSLRNFYEIVVELIIKHSSSSPNPPIVKETEFAEAYKSCNRSLAIFIKV
jgi:hypothetical protein